MASEVPRDSSYEDATLAANTQSETNGRPKSPKPDYLSIIENGDIGSSQNSDYVRVSDSDRSSNNLGSEISSSRKSDYITVSEVDKRENNMECEQEQPEYCDPTDIHIKVNTTLNARSFPQRGENTGNEIPMQIVPPIMLYKEKTDTYQRIEDVEPHDEPPKGGITHQNSHVDEPNKNKRCFKVCTVIVIIIIIGLVTAVSVLVNIVLENKNSQSPGPSPIVSSNFTTQRSMDLMNTFSSGIHKTTDRDERESTTNEELTTFGQKTSITPDITTTTPVQLTSTSTIPHMSTVKISESTASEELTIGQKTSITPTVAPTTPVQSTSTSTIPLTSTIKVPGYPKDCKEIRDLNIKITSVYTIYPYSRSQAVNVMCDMTRENGGWTVFQRRFDGSVDFYQVWKSYKNGFGSVTGEHWLGNDVLHQLTALGESFLYVVLEDFDGKEYVAEYSNFTVADESDQYRFWISEFMGGNAKNAIEGWEANNVNGMQFSTYDRDNDKAIGSCAVARHGAWWYNECTMTNLNGRYPVDGGVCGDCNFWFRIFENFIGLKKTMMMVRRK